MAEEKRKPPRWESEEWTMKSPDLDKIRCKDCAWRAEDRVFSGGTVLKGATLGICKVMGTKPYGVLWHGEDCSYYLKEEKKGEKK